MQSTVEGLFATKTTWIIKIPVWITTCYIIKRMPQQIRALDNLHEDSPKLICKGADDLEHYAFEYCTTMNDAQLVSVCAAG